MNQDLFWQIINGLQWLLGLFLIWTGVPFFVGMIIFQGIALILTMLILAKFNAPEIAYKVVGASVFFGMGIAVVVTPMGWFVFILECVLAIPALGILRGYAFTKPRIRAFSIGSDMSHHEIQADQVYLGPGQFRPEAAQMMEKAAAVVEKLAGYDQSRLPSGK